MQIAVLEDPRLALPFTFFPETELVTFIIASFIYRLGNGRVSFKMKGIKAQGKKKDFAEAEDLAGALFREVCINRPVRLISHILATAFCSL